MAVEIFFPDTIDKLKKERSDITGMKPIILESNNFDHLFYMLLGEEHQKES